MLGTKTKQVFSYGRRGHRIVNVSERDSEKQDENTSAGSISSRKKLQPVVLLSKRAKPAIRPVATPASPEPSPSPSPPRKRKVIKKRLPSSPLSSPDFSYKPKRVRQIIAKSKGSPTSKPLSSSSRGSNSQSSSAVTAASFSTPGSRTPLSSQSPNVPRLAAPTFAGKKKGRVSGSKGTPLKQSLSPFVDVDIVVVDDAGHRFSHERRVSRTDVQVNPTIFTSPHEDSALSSDSDGEYLPAPKRPSKRSRAKIVISSSDESDAPASSHRPPKAASSRTSAPKPPSRPAKAPPAAPSVDPVARNNLVLNRPVPSDHSKRPETNGTAPSKPVVQAPNVVHSSNKPSIGGHADQGKLPLPKAKPSRSALEPALYIDTTQRRHSPMPARSKPRPLTPARYRHSVFPRPPSPLSSSTSDDDYDLSVDLAELTLSDTPHQSEPTIPPPSYLLPLLTECGQTTAHEFSAFIESFPFDPIVQQNSDAGKVAFQKIGEASYSEVFGIGDVVLKVIPLSDEDIKSGGAGFGEAETPAPSNARDVLKEMIVTRAMGEMCDGFVKLLRTYVVRGKYPSLLLDLWDGYHERKGSESIRPGPYVPCSSSS